MCGLWPAPRGGSQLRLVTVRLDRLIVRSILQHRRENIELTAVVDWCSPSVTCSRGEATLCLFANGSMVGSSFCVMSVHSKKTNLITHDVYSVTLDFSSSVSSWYVPHFSPGVITPLIFVPSSPEVFQQQLDVCRAWFIKDDGSTLAHREIDQSIQNRAVFIVILGKTKCCSLLENHLTLRLVKDFIHNLLFTSKQDVVTGSPTCRGFRVVHFFRTDCSFRFGTRLQHFSCSRSRRIHEPRLPSHGVFEEVVQPCQVLRFSSDKVMYSSREAGGWKCARDTSSTSSLMSNFRPCRRLQVLTQ